MLHPHQACLWRPRDNSEAEIAPLPLISKNLGLFDGGMKGDMCRWCVLGVFFKKFHPNKEPTHKKQKKRHQESWCSCYCHLDILEPLQVNSIYSNWFLRWYTPKAMFAEAPKNLSGPDFPVQSCESHGIHWGGKGWPGPNLSKSLPLQTLEINKHITRTVLKKPETSHW